MSIEPNSSEQEPSPYEHTRLFAVDSPVAPGRQDALNMASLGFRRITARGFDVASAQIDIARLLARDLISMPGVDLSFGVSDLESRMPERDASVDVTLCLYSVLSHLRVTALRGVAKELGRVTRGHFVSTVRSIGSTPTVFIDSLEKVRHLNLDHARDRCDIEFLDGRRLSLRFHLFTANELKTCSGEYFDTEDLCGLDLFHTRFSPDRRWNPSGEGLSRAVDDRRSLRNRPRRLGGLATAGPNLRPGGGAGDQLDHRNGKSARRKPLRLGLRRRADEPVGSGSGGGPPQLESNYHIRLG